MFTLIGEILDELVQGCLLVLGWFVAGAVIAPVIGFDWYVWLTLVPVIILICIRVLVFVFQVLVFVFVLEALAALIEGMMFIYGALRACFEA